jgi:hypothetical protein
MFIALVGDVETGVMFAFVVDVNDDLPALVVHQLQTSNRDLAFLASVDHHLIVEETHFGTNCHVPQLILHLLLVEVQPRGLGE